MLRRYIKSMRPIWIYQNDLFCWDAFMVCFKRPPSRSWPRDLNQRILWHLATSNYGGIRPQIWLLCDTQDVTFGDNQIWQPLVAKTCLLRKCWIFLVTQGVFLPKATDLETSGMVWDIYFLENFECIIQENVGQ